MTDREKADLAIEKVDGLIALAISILNRKPFGLSIADDAICWLTMKGDEASLAWTREFYGEYDEGLKLETSTFPAFLLFAPENDVKAWLKKEYTAQKARDSEMDKAARADRDRRDREVYEALKARFEATR